MKIHLTKHSKQRRSHYDITPDKHILEWINHFDVLFNLSNLQNNRTYKVHSGGSAAILKKTKGKVLVITFRGFKDFEKVQFMNFRIQDVTEKNERKVQRRNLNGRNVTCANIYDSKNDKGEYFIKFKKGVIEKYMVPFNKRIIHFNSIDDLSHFLEEDKFGRLFLKEFERRPEEVVKIKNHRPTPKQGINLPWRIKKYHKKED